MHMNFIFPDSAFYGDDYTITIELENVSDKILYGVSIQNKWILNSVK